MKYCSGCDCTHPKEDFYPNKAQKDGLSNWCKMLLRADKKRRQKADPEKFLEQGRRWRAANPEKVKAIWTRSAKKNHTKKLAATASWWKAHPKENVAKVFKWSRENPSKVKALRVARSARLRNAHGMVTSVQIDELFNLYRGLCAYCANPARTIDHVVPLSRGGPHEIGNLLPACARCNFSKGAKSLDEWLLRAA